MQHLLLLLLHWCSTWTLLLEDQPVLASPRLYDSHITIDRIGRAAQQSSDGVAEGGTASGGGQSTMTVGGEGDNSCAAV
jgi:hypothetical protein